MIELEDMENAMEIIFNPEKFGYISCWDCEGEGARISEENNVNVYDMCDTCGGDGVMKNVTHIDIDGDNVVVRERGET